MIARIRRPGQRLCAAVAATLGCALAHGALALPIRDLATPESLLPDRPAELIEIEPCPPRCEAHAQRALTISDLRKPIQPDEWVLDGDVQVLWGDIEDRIVLIWGGVREVVELVWQESMWVEPVAREIQVEFATEGGRDASHYGLSREDRERLGKTASLRNERDRAKVRISIPRAALDRQRFEPSEIPPELLWTRPPGAFAQWLVSISQSRSVIAALTLALVYLMIRLAR